MRYVALLTAMSSRTLLTDHLRTKFSAIRLPLFPELKIALKGRRFNDMAMIATKLCYVLAKFQILLFTECFKQ